MRGTVRFFASLREATGRSEGTWELADGATVGALLVHLRVAHPDLGERIDRAWVAVNRRYAGPETALRHGDEVALFPPVSGG
jgi:molybdopterin converting factor subunit 1